MKNYFYGAEIAKKIQSLLDTHLPDDTAKNINIGDFTIIPSPEYISEYVPAVLISQTAIDITPSNKALDIYFTPYAYDIRYIFPITLEHEQDSNKKFKQGAEYIANILMNYKALDSFRIDQNEKEQGGLVVDTEVENIVLDSEESIFFAQLEIPALVANIRYVVGFRTYQTRGV